MKESEQQEEQLEQILRSHYRVHFSAHYGSAPSAADLRQYVLTHHKPVSGWRRLFARSQAVSSRSGADMAVMRRPMPKLAVASILIAALLVISTTAYAVRISLLDRFLKQNPATRSLEFTDVNIKKNVGHSIVHIQKAFADANNVIIAYTVENKEMPEQEPGFGAALTTSDGTVLTFRQESGVGGWQDPEKKPEMVSLYHFDGKSIQGNPQSLSLKLVLTPREKPYSYEATGPSVAFEFTLPFHAARVISVNQTVTSHGYTLTVNRVVITPTSVRVYIGVEGDSSPVKTELHIAGKTYQSQSGLKAPPGQERAIIFDPWLTNGFENLLAQTGTWNLKVSEISSLSGQIHGDWQFTFVVP